MSDDGGELRCSECRRSCQDGIIRRGKPLCFPCHFRRVHGLCCCQTSLFGDQIDQLVPETTDLGCVRCTTRRVQFQGGRPWCGFCGAEIAPEDILPGVTSSLPVRGWVYALTNLAMPGLLKIGRTVHQPDERAAQLGLWTGVPLPFRVAYQQGTGHCVEAEEAVHTTLAGWRVSQRREFFAVGVEEATSAIQEACDRVDAKYGFRPGG